MDSRISNLYLSFLGGGKALSMPQIISIQLTTYCLSGDLAL